MHADRLAGPHFTTEKHHNYTDSVIDNIRLSAVCENVAIGDACMLWESHENEIMLLIRAHSYITSRVPTEQVDRR